MSHYTLTNAVRVIEGKIIKKMICQFQSYRELLATEGSSYRESTVVVSYLLLFPACSCKETKEASIDSGQVFHFPPLVLNTSHHYPKLAC